MDDERAAFVGCDGRGVDDAEGNGLERELKSEGEACGTCPNDEDGEGVCGGRSHRLFCYFLRFPQTFTF